ncbi:MAG: PD-(D/E)XK nuclease family protein [Thermodesulfobacteriota bacterium]|nr:PD-(D/E)XK nuclease family protein [Thermodesulfobacteriota bacterium]
MKLQLVQPTVGEKNLLHVSYSQIYTYLLCPMKYAHNYVWANTAESRPLALIYGKAVHHGVEGYYNCIKETGATLPVEELIQLFETSFDEEVKKSELKISMKKNKTLESAKGQGIELLKLFHTEIRPQKIVAVEFPFSVPIPDINNGGNLPFQLVGYFDLVESDKEGTYIIGELKTSGQKFNSLRLKYDLQPTAYSYAMSKMKQATCLVRYDVLVKTKKPAFEQYFVSRTAAEHERLIHLINNVLSAIEHRLFYRNMGWQCQDCQYKNVCLQ